MAIITWIIENIDNIVLVIAALLSVAKLIKYGESTKLKQTLMYLVTQAEIDFGSGTGSLKLAAVADWVYQRIPNALKVLFTPKDIEKMIEDALDIAKQKWETNSNLQTLIQSNANKIDTEEFKKVINDIAASNSSTGTTNTVMVEYSDK